MLREPRWNPGGCDDLEPPSLEPLTGRGFGHRGGYSREGGRQCGSRCESRSRRPDAGEYGAARRQGGVSMYRSRSAKVEGCGLAKFRDCGGAAAAG
jgi:hypothetical protein